MAVHHSQLQTRPMKRMATILMLGKCAPKPRERVKGDFDTFDETGDNPIDNSGYISDDGLDQDFADAAEEIENDEWMYPWKPCVSSPPKNEEHPMYEISSKKFPARPKSTRCNQALLGPRKEQEIRDHIALIVHLTSRDLNEKGKRLRPKDYGQGDHRDRSNCGCRSTAVTHSILRIGGGHLTPERVRKTTHQQLRLIAHHQAYGATEKDLASNTTNNAC